MENQLDDDESEKISDSFVCCVCLDLLYKPIVLACGHVSCFWCVHKSMNGLLESHCPICRCPYHHFPTVCQMLHFLLLKMYPITYKRRENLILEEEKRMDCFSPNFDDLVCASHTNELNCVGDLGQSSATTSQSNLPSDQCSTRKGEACAYIKQLESLPSPQEDGRTNPKEISSGSFESISTVSVDENKLCQRCSNGTHEQVSIADLLCAACKQLLFRPVVLNCGHVYCETCIVIPAEDTLICQVCQSSHPRGFPKVCLELHHFLEEQFPAEYALRRCTAQLKQDPIQHKSLTTCSTKAGKKGFDLSFPAEGNLISWWADHDANVHIGAGCDSCGMYPIIGDRYRCKDCVEAIGFDLCGDCYNTRSKLPGRFNQQHTPEHRFETVKANSIRNIMLKLWGQLEDGYATPDLADDTFENLENIIPSSSNDVPENVENGPTVEDKSDDQSPV